MPWKARSYSGTHLISQRSMQRNITYPFQRKQSRPGALLYNAWTKKGFGFWAHLVFDIGIRLVMHAMARMRGFGFEPGQRPLPAHFPHPIITRSSSRPRATRSRRTTTRCRRAVAHREPQGAREQIDRRVDHGARLAHLRGGTDGQNGATYIYEPMTPARLLICLQAYNIGVWQHDERRQGSLRGRPDAQETAPGRAAHVFANRARRLQKATTYEDPANLRAYGAFLSLVAKRDTVSVYTLGMASAI